MLAVNSEAYFALVWGALILWLLIVGAAACYAFIRRRWRYLWLALFVAVTGPLASQGIVEALLE